MRIEFTKEKMAAIEKISKELLTESVVDIGQSSEDFLADTLSFRLSASIYSNMSEERDLVYEFKRPTFLDWLLRRKRIATFKLKVKDLLLIPPAMPKMTERIYLIDSE